MRSRFYLFLPLIIATFYSAAQEGVVQTDSVSTVVVEPPKESSVNNFSVVTQNEPVVVRKVPTDKVESLKQSDDYWYANLPPKKKDLPQHRETRRGNGLFAQEWFRNLLWLVVLCSFICIVIWYLASSNANLFRKQARRIDEESEEGSIDEDIFSIDYNKEIQIAVGAENFRLAVRLLYLQILKELADRDLIKYRVGRTNSDYVGDLAGGNHYGDFFRLTRIFEYTWYGGFALDKEAFSQTQPAFQNFKNSLGR